MVKKGRVFRDQAIILRSYKLSESDKIVRILTREHGKRSVVAKGLRKTTSRFGARLEPLSHVDILLYEGRSMDTVQQVETKRSFKELRENLNLFVIASAMAELADSLTQEHDPHPEVFDLLLRALILAGDSRDSAEFIFSFFEFKLLAAVGYGPGVEFCVLCGEPVGGGAASFSLDLGGLVCSSCSKRRFAETGRLIRIGRQCAQLLEWVESHSFGVLPKDEAANSSGARELAILLEKVAENLMEREFKSRKVMREIPSDEKHR